jgi:hypothetical protein
MKAAPDPRRPDRRPPAACAAFRDRWLAGLDSPDTQADPTAGGDDPHLTTCGECRSWLVDARRFAGGLRLLALPADPPALPHAWSLHIADAVLDDRAAFRGRRRWVVRILSTAAAVVLAAGLGLWGGGHLRFDRPLAVHVRSNPVTKPTPPAPPLGESLASAVGPVVDKARRTADQTFAGARALFAAPTSLPGMGSGMDDWESDIGPATRALDEARQGAAGSLEPVASSFRRAVDLFSRELTTPAGTPGRDQPR